MAISWSSRVGNYWQVGVEVVETGRTDTTFTYRYRAYVRSSWHTQLYSDADWECWIDTGSDNSDWHISSGGEQEGRWIDTQNDNPVLLREQSFTVSRTANARSRVAYARFWGGHNTASRGDRTVSQSLTIPALPTYAPNAVSNVSAALSGSSIKLTWQNNIANLRPYAGIYIYRSVDGGSYYLLKDVSGSSTSYTDTSISNDHSYTYRVLPHNAAGNASNYVYSSTS